MTNVGGRERAQNLAFLCLFTAIAIAVLKYRLYDIDIVISKAVLYGSLAVFITAVYAALVVGVGTLAGNTRSPLLTALAAAVVAVAFQPLRQRAGRLANRVVYGRRATPYQVLSDFAQRDRRHVRGRGGAAADGADRGGGHRRRARWWYGCGWATNSTPRPPQTATRAQARCPLMARRCRRCRRPRSASR